MSMQQKLLDQSMQQGMGKGRIEEGVGRWESLEMLDEGENCNYCICSNNLWYIKYIFWWYIP